jgi:hypothetical protein
MNEVQKRDASRRYAINADKLKAYQKRYRETHQEKLKKYHQMYRSQHPNLKEKSHPSRMAFSLFKEAIGCQAPDESKPNGICGFNKFGGVLHFHHRDPKTKTMSVRYHNYQTDAGRAEMEKCILLCANCHGTLHWGKKEN